MRALQLTATDGPDALELADLPDPEAADGMCVLDVHAAGVGFVDYLVTRGEYQIKFDLPFVPGVEIAGTVRAAPDGSELSPGDHVSAFVMPGGLADTALAPLAFTFPIPDDMPFTAAAGFVVNHQTAHLALKVRGRLAAGESVLVHGAAGGVGVACLQVAKALGATTVIAAASSEDKRAFALAQGADATVDSSGDWVDAVKELTDGRGVDVVVDPVGRPESLRCMAPFGRLLIVGFAAGDIPEIKVNRLLLRSHDVVGVNFGGLLPFDQEFPRRAHEDLMRWWSDGRISEVPGDRYPLADGAKALAAFGQRAVLGKPVITTR